MFLFNFSEVKMIGKFGNMKLLEFGKRVLVIGEVSINSVWAVMFKSDVCVCYGVVLGAGSGILITLQGAADRAWW